MPRHLIIGRFAMFRAAEPRLFSYRPNRLPGYLCGIELQLFGLVTYIPIGRRAE